MILGLEKEIEACGGIIIYFYYFAEKRRDGDFWSWS